MKKRIFEILSCLLFLLMPLSCSFNKKIEGAKVYIVAIGLCYEGSNALSGPVSDVTEFAEYYRSILESKSIDYEIYYMLDREAEIQTIEVDGKITRVLVKKNDFNSPYYPTVENLNAVLNNIKEKSSEKDLLVFLYSGHGAETSLKDNLTGSPLWGADDNGALVLRKFITLEIDEESATYLSADEYLLSTLVETLKQMPLSKAVIMDSCFSGNLVGSMLEGESVGESIGSKGESYIGQDNFYKVSFSSLADVTNFAAVTSSRASETSMEVGPPYDDELFSGETHGLFFGPLLTGLGFTHSTKGEPFSKIPSSTSENAKIHSSLSEELSVYGKLPDKAFMNGLEFSTNEIFKIARKANNDYNETYSSSQLTQQHFGPVGIKLAW